MQRLRRFAEVGNTLHSSGAGTNNADALVFEFIEPTLGGTTGVVIIPTAGVEGVAFKVINAGNTRQLWTI